MAMGCLGLLVLGGLAVLAILFAVAMQPDAPVEAPGAVADEAPQPSSAPSSLPSPTDESYRVAGLVVDGGGEGVPDVEVLARTNFTTQDRTTTDAFGAFELQVVGAASIHTEGLVTTPANHVVAGPRDDLLFRVAERCPIEVLVVDAEDVPVEGARVRGRARIENMEHTRLADRTTDVAGRVRLDHAPCRILSLKVTADGYPMARRRGVDPTEHTEIRVQLADGIVLQGQVTDASGLPVEEAKVSAGGQSTEADDDGRYALVVAPAAVRGVTADHEGYRKTTVRLRLSEGEAGPVEQDLVLEPSNIVDVRCLGLPDDSCETVVPLMCTRTFLPWGSVCEPATPTQCECPLGAAAIRGGAKTTLVPPGAKEAVLDFRDGGGIRGTVRLEGQPTPCRVTVTYLPQDLSAIKAGLAGIQMVECRADGTFEAFGLEPGGYHVDVSAQGIQKQFTQVDVQDVVVDLGLIELESGGVIEGFVVDGKTKEPAVDQMVIAVASADPDDPAPAMGQGMTGPGGAFPIVGLQDGTYDVILATRPFEKEPVTVEGGEAPEVLLETSGTDLLTDQGFELETDPNGDLVVSDVLADGRAAAAGLQTGDVIEGVTFMGFDPAEVLGEAAPLFTDLILDNFTGRGAGLNVRRGDELLSVPLQSQ